MAKQTPPTEYTADSSNPDLQELYNQLETQLRDGRDGEDYSVVDTTTNPQHPVLVTMSIIADWYEDANKVSWAEAMRWAVVNRKTPMDYQPLLGLSEHGDKFKNSLPQGRDTVWQWWDVTSPMEGHPASDIPGVVFDLLQTGGDFRHPNQADTDPKNPCQYYLYIQFAYEDFCQAWNRARAEGWDAVWRGKHEEEDYGYESETDFGDFYEDDAFPDYDNS